MHVLTTDDCHRPVVTGEGLLVVAVAVATSVAVGLGVAMEATTVLVVGLGALVDLAAVAEGSGIEQYPE